MISDVPAHVRTSSYTPTILVFLSLLIVSSANSQWAIAAGAGASQRDNSTAQKVASISLLDHNGQRVTEERFVGKPSVIFFGFTGCPDICPTTLYDMTKCLQKLGADADELNVVFVSVDPEFDTVDVLQKYLSNFDSRIIGLTGDPAIIAALAKSLGATFKRVSAEDGNYVFEHSILHFLVDRNWRKSGAIYVRPSDDGQAHAVKKLRNLIHQQ